MIIVDTKYSKGVTNEAGAGEDTFVFNFSTYKLAGDKTTDHTKTIAFKYTNNSIKFCSGFGVYASGCKQADVRKTNSAENPIYESYPGKLWYDAGGTGTTEVSLNFATIQAGIPDTHW